MREEDKEKEREIKQEKEISKSWFKLQGSQESVYGSALFYDKHTADICKITILQQNTGKTLNRCF